MSVAEIRNLADRIRSEVRKAIVGQDATVDLLLVALFSSGHVLLEGAPGTAKTLLAQCFSKAISLQFGRIQFTPDLMPGDVLGTNLFNFQTNQFSLTKGPIFTDILLADEINRTPPKTQAALLEAMQERKVTIDGVSYGLNPRFTVIATQNPIEQQGTYPLPEAQQDRFMFKVFVRYPSFDEEFEIARRTTGGAVDEPRAVLAAHDILALQAAVREVPISDHLVRYALTLVRQTRLGERGVPEFVSDQLSCGAGPRAVRFLVVGAKTRAVLQGRSHVSLEDIQALAAPVLRHLIVVGFAAESEGVTPDAIIERIIATTPTREDELARDPRFQTIFTS